MKVKSHDTVAISFATNHNPLDLDKPIFTLSVASEILEVHPRTLMMYEHLSMISPKRTVTNRRRYSRRDVMNLQAIQTLNREETASCPVCGRDAQAIGRRHVQIVFRCDGCKVVFKRNRHWPYIC